MLNISQGLLKSSPGFVGAVTGACDIMRDTRDGREKIICFFVVVIAIVRLCSGSLNRVLHNREREV